MKPSWNKPLIGIKGCHWPNHRFAYHIPTTAIPGHTCHTVACLRHRQGIVTRWQDLGTWEQRTSWARSALGCNTNKDHLVLFYSWKYIHSSIYLSNLSIYLSMHACMHGWMYVCMHGCMYVCTYVCMAACMHISYIAFARNQPELRVEENMNPGKQCSDLKRGEKSRSYSWWWPGNFAVESCDHPHPHHTRLQGAKEMVLPLSSWHVILLEKFCLARAFQPNAIC